MIVDNWNKGAAWMDQAIMPIAEAKISVLDWGLTHSDITYDVVTVWNGRFFRINDYLERFERSVEKCRLNIPQGRDDIKRILHDIVARSGLRQSYVSMVASRGAPTTAGSRDPRDCANHFYAWNVPFVWVFTEPVVERGAHLQVPEKLERIAPQAVDPTAKNYHWGDFTRGLIDAKETGFDNTLLLDGVGNITEGPGFNVFGVKDGSVMTPKSGVLEGITRRTALEIAETLGLNTEVREISFEEFLDADEAFATTSGGGIVPITKVNNRTFSNGVPGEVTQLLAGIYWDWHNDPEMSEVVEYL